jgi:hypothetical protein
MGRGGRCGLPPPGLRGTKPAVVTSSNQSFGTGDLVEVDTANVRAVARVRESNGDGRLHIALELGEYLPWVDEDVLIRHFGNDPMRSCTAKILHAGSTTALLQIIEMVEQVRTPAQGIESLGHVLPFLRGPQQPIPSIDDDW